MRILLVAFVCLALVAAEAEWLKNFPKEEAGHNINPEHMEEVEEPERERTSEEYGTYREVEREGKEEEEREEPETEPAEEEYLKEEEERAEAEEAEEDVEPEEEEEEEDEEVELEHRRHHRPHHRRGGRGHHDRRYPHRPRFCGRSDCPRFRLMKEYRGYELRCYPPYSWVTTKNDVLDSKDFGGMFKRLIAYIKGKNSRRAKLPMKTPVGVTMKYNITDHKTKSMMSFFLSGACCPRCNCHRRGPPKPLDPKVFIMRTPEFCAYVRSFDGWVMSRGWSYYKQLWYLTKDLQRDGKDDYYAKGLSGFAGYNPPWQLFNRHNEVWRFFKCPHCNKTEGSMEMFKYIQEEVEKENTPVMVP